MDNIKFSTILVELDALLDTRIATIGRMGGDVLKTVLASNYHSRLIDYWEGIDNDQFKELYTNRNIVTLKESILTNIGILVADFCKKTIELNTTSPFHYKPKVSINIHPYKLTDSDINTVISSVVMLIDGMGDVEAIDVPYSYLTPKYLLQNTSVVVLYKYDDWLEANSVNDIIKKERCPEIGLIGPAMYFKRNDKLPDKEPFRDMEKLISPIIDLKLLPVSDFSFILPKLDK